MESSRSAFVRDDSAGDGATAGRAGVGGTGRRTGGAAAAGGCCPICVNPDECSQLSGILPPPGRGAGMGADCTIGVGAVKLSSRIDR